MKTRLPSTFQPSVPIQSVLRRTGRLPLSALGLLAAFTLLVAAPHAPAQTVWTNALSFDGVDDYVVFNRPVSNDFTLECWFRSTQHAGLGNDQWNWGMGLVDGTVPAYGVFCDFGLSLGSGRVLFGTGGTNNKYVTIRSGDVANGQWHHVAATRQRSIGRMELYMDGQLVASGTNGTETLDAPAQLRLGGIGMMDGSISNFFQGDVDEVRIWDAVRSGDEIRQHLGHPLIGMESNLVACFRLDEGAGSTAFDSTTNGYNGTVNGPQWMNSSIPPWGSALSFDGTDDAVTVNGLTLTNTSLTIEAWARRASANTLDGFVGQGTNTSGKGLFFCMYGDGKVGFSFYAGGLYTRPVYNDTNWHHWAATRDQATGQRCIYCDGQLVTNDVQAVSYTGSGTLWIGLVPWDASSYFHGQLDEVRIWNRVRSQAEIQADLIHPLTGSESNLVAYYRFDEWGGTIAHDRMTNSHNGNLSGGTIWTNSTIPTFININAGLPGVFLGSVTWGDCDNDDDLDILLTGHNGSDIVAEVWRNTGNGFTNINAGLPGVCYSSAAWGDYDNDGWLDILLTGATNNTVTKNITQVWRNTGAGFTNINAGLPGVNYGSAAWGDYDNDGRLDILLTGTTNDYRTDNLAQVWRNTGHGFTDINAGLTGVCYGSAAWGDYDHDGRLDILLTGYNGSNAVTEVWRNTESGFTNINAELTGVTEGSVAWGDYDNDGRLDVLLTGTTQLGQNIAEVWRNADSGFTNINASLTGVKNGSGVWGDFDNDGRLDILLTGWSGTGPVSELWRNTGNGFMNINAGLNTAYYSSVAWADYDNDGQLDILLTGKTNYFTSGYAAQVWRNIGPLAKTPPSAPVNLTSAVADQSVTLSWSTSTDAQTSTNGLTYNLRVGTTPGGCDVVSPHADPANGFRRLAALGNAQFGLTATLTNLSPGPYFWSVQAVDTAFAGSPFAAEGSWVVPGPPMVTTLAASDLVAVGSNACVMLNGTVNPGQLPTTSWFEWGTTTNYGNTTPVIRLSATYGGLPVSHRLCGLAADSSYHVRLVATNSLGSTAGDDLVFSTQPENLALNPGFESGTTGWFGFGWSILTATNDIAHSGSFSGLASNRSNSWCGPAQSLIGMLQANCSYRVSIWVRLAEGTSQYVQLTMLKTDSNGTLYQRIAGDTATSTNWMQLSGSYVLTVYGALAELLLYVEGPAAGVNFYADDFVIELERVIAPPPEVAGWMAGSDAFVISFASQLGQTYRVECSDSLSPTAWAPVTEGLAGTGYSIQVTNTGAPFPAQRFYRVVLMSP